MQGSYRSLFAGVLLSVALTIPSAGQPDSAAQADLAAQAESKVKEKVGEKDEARQAEKAMRRAERAERKARREAQSIARSYAQGARSLDKREWAEAVEHFKAVAESGETRADGAMYWEAYALMKQAQMMEAKSRLEALATQFPKSRWLNDAKALEMLISASAGTTPSPELEEDEELKLYAINALANTDPERAAPLLRKVLEDPNPPQLKERALFVLAMTESPLALPIVEEIAKGGGNPDLQVKAIEYLGMNTSGEVNPTLAEIYKSGDSQAKRAVLRAFVHGGHRKPLLEAVRNESDPALMKEAIRGLGAMQAAGDLSELYASETSSEIRGEILRASALTGDASLLIEVATNGTDTELRGMAIQHLGMIHDGKATEVLTTLYRAEADPKQRRRIVQALFMQQKAEILVSLARQEQDAETKKYIVQHLSQMDSDVATEYMMELLGR